MNPLGLKPERFTVAVAGTPGGGERVVGIVQVGKRWAGGQEGERWAGGWVAVGRTWAGGGTAVGKRMDCGRAGKAPYLLA